MFMSKQHLIYPFISRESIQTNANAVYNLNFHVFLHTNFSVIVPPSTI